MNFKIQTFERKIVWSPLVSIGDPILILINFDFYNIIESLSIFIESFAINLDWAETGITVNIILMN